MSQRTRITNARIVGEHRADRHAPVRAIGVAGVLRYRDGQILDGPGGRALGPAH